MLQTELFPKSAPPFSPSISFPLEISCSLPFKDNFFYYLHNITTTYTLTLSANQNLKIATKHTVLESLYGEGTTNVTRLDISTADDLGCPNTSSNTFTLHFCNIRSIRSNFQSVKYHLSFTKPFLLFLNVTQLSVTGEWLWYVFQAYVVTCPLSSWFTVS